MRRDMRELREQNAKLLEIAEEFSRSCDLKQKLIDVLEENKLLLNIKVKLLERHIRETKDAKLVAALERLIEEVEDDMGDDIDVVAWAGILAALTAAKAAIREAKIER